MGERLRPFRTPAAFACWKSRNCSPCTLRWQVEQRYRCDIEAALDYADFDNGTVTNAIGKLLGFDGQNVAEDCQARELVEVENG